MFLKLSIVVRSASGETLSRDSNLVREDGVETAGSSSSSSSSLSTS